MLFDYKFEWINNKDKRDFIGSWGYVILVFAVIGFLGFKEVPKVNKDLITTIIGMLVSSLSIVVYRLVGKEENEIKNLKKDNEILREKNDNLAEKVDELQDIILKMQNRIITELSYLKK